MKLNFRSKANYDEWFEHEDKINLNNSFAVLLIHIRHRTYGRHFNVNKTA